MGDPSDVLYDLADVPRRDLGFCGSSALTVSDDADKAAAAAFADALMTAAYPDGNAPLVTSCTRPRPPD
ncbi:hypothetical protein NUW54_g8499 [Trametes sanguinea]|uniref:Uncharacterized protein n=1 Tax=Trametes sanguinea TaxID=158606 RepID=A0ACC1PEN4_9APHY|nr:hypothetical protein NUW54_g8499 [Trametes sanguinea]